MGYFKPDVYYQPEIFGLKRVGEVEWSDGSYQFDLSVVWQDECGNLLYGEDSGCSCPGIFEEYVNGAEDLEFVTFGQLQQKLADRLDGKKRYRVENDWASQEPAIEDLNGQVVDLLSKVRAL
jgi:hypothetical protein